MQRVRENGRVRRYRSVPVTAERDDHGEGPCWDARTGQLLRVDQYVGAVVLADWDASAKQLTTARRFDVGSPIGAVVPTTGAEGDGWMIAAAHGFARLASDGTVTLLDQPESSAPVRMRMNDGKCDGRGRFWAGSMAFDKVPGAATLYRLDPDLTVTVALRDVTISNGLAWTVDGQHMFYIDTPTRRVDRFRVAPDGTLSERTTAVRIGGDGFPDGMSIDVEGCLWVALWGAGAVHRYAPSGELLAVVEVGAEQVSSCCFGGADGRTLFITTSQEDMDDAARAEHRDAGRVFAVEVDTSAPPAAPFGAL